MALIASFGVFAAVLFAITVFGYIKYVKPSRLIDQLTYQDRANLPLAADTGADHPLRAMLMHAYFPR